MDTISALQLATSAVALLCSGVSLGTWFFFVTRLRSPRIILQKPILLSQAGIGFLHVAGTFLLLILSIYRPLYKQGMVIDPFPNRETDSNLIRLIKANFHLHDWSVVDATNHS